VSCRNESHPSLEDGVLADEPVLKATGYYAAFIALGLFGASMGPTLPYLAQHTGSRLSEISFLFTARALAICSAP